MKNNIHSDDELHLSLSNSELPFIAGEPEHKSVRYTLKKGTVSRAIRHETVTEFWHILSGDGAIWKRNKYKESITPLKAGMSIDVPWGTDFQYCSEEEDLVFICVTLPDSPAPDEIKTIEDCAWKPTYHD